MTGNRLRLALTLSKSHGPKCWLWTDWKNITDQVFSKAFLGYAVVTTALGQKYISRSNVSGGPATQGLLPFSHPDHPNNMFVAKRFKAIGDLEEGQTVTGMANFDEAKVTVEFSSTRNGYQYIPDQFVVADGGHPGAGVPQEYYCPQEHGNRGEDDGQEPIDSAPSGLDLGGHNETSIDGQLVHNLRRRHNDNLVSGPNCRVECVRDERSDRQDKLKRFPALNSTAAANNFVSFLAPCAAGTTHLRPAVQRGYQAG